jgi:beta-galactosidase/beta-glucuronidase
MTGRLCALLAPLLAAALHSPGAHAQQVETSVPPSDRITIDLSAGMPGQSHWLYVKDQDSANFTAPTFDDSSWTQAGIPHGANYLTTFVNTTSGGGGGDMNGGNNWYRLHFTLGTQYANSKVMVELEGAHTGAQVYINGTLLAGISAVAADAKASHVVGFLPFIVDLTPYLHTDGVTQNVLAVSVSRNNSWFESPTFSGAFRFGQAEAGLFRPARMFITNEVHIPANVYSNQKTWGTYVATLSEVPSPTSTAQASSAVVEVQTNVLNETTTSQQVTLTTQIVDAQGNVVAVAPPASLAVKPDVGPDQHARRGGSHARPGERLRARLHPAGLRSRGQKPVSQQPRLRHGVLG